MGPPGKKAGKKFKTDEQASPFYSQNNPGRCGKSSGMQRILSFSRPSSTRQVVEIKRISCFATPFAGKKKAHLEDGQERCAHGEKKTRTIKNDRGGEDHEGGR
jgi:hypothetical protein